MSKEQLEDIMKIEIPRDLFQYAIYFGDENNFYINYMLNKNSLNKIFKLIDTLKKG